jgi:hypothetical protein
MDRDQHVVEEHHTRGRGEGRARQVECGVGRVQAVWALQSVQEGFVALSSERNRKNRRRLEITMDDMDAKNKSKPEERKNVPLRRPDSHLPSRQ